MTPNKDESYYRDLVRELSQYAYEPEWAEFKVNKYNSEDIGEYISALSNSATLNGKTHGYLIWGINDESHDIVGTTFTPSTLKIGNELLETWLHHLINPIISFHFHEIQIEEKRIVILEIERAYHQPIRFKNEEYIRIGSVKKKLKDAPEREKELWNIFRQIPFEEGTATERLDGATALRLLDFQAYFDLLNKLLPLTQEGILEVLKEDKLVCPSDAGGYYITNLGAILLAKKLSEFDIIKRKKPRIIRYTNKDRTKTEREIEIEKGYANGFSDIISQINTLLPSNEVIEQTLRKTVPMYPEIALRELVANALIHQNFYITGTGPMIEIFSNRIEITNPGEPLVDIRRFVDTPPKSRNESLASLMRRFTFCEERGSGIDKVITQVEYYQLPPPLFEVPPDSTRVVLFAPRQLSEMDKEERIRAIYQHSCLRYVNRQQMVNASIRERFGLEKGSKSKVSRYIREALEAGVIKLVDDDAADRLKAYIPYWA